MIGIKAIGSYVPQNFIDNYKRVKEFETDASFIRDKIGFESLSRKSQHEETSDLCVKAFEDLLSHTGVEAGSIGCIVVCTQNPDGTGLPQTSAILQHKLRLKDNVAAFDISLGCSGYIYGLSILKAFMSENGLRKGLLFTADPYSKVLDPADRNTELLFGDAATCTLISEQPEYIMLKSRFATDGSAGNSIFVDKATSLLSMKGKDIFMFSMKKVPAQIEECLADNSLEKEQIDIFIFHQASKYIVDNLTKSLGLPAEKAPFLARKTGNTVSSSIPLVLRELLFSGYQHILLSGFGVGLSWATTILKKSDE